MSFYKLLTSFFNIKYRYNELHSLFLDKHYFYPSYPQFYLTNTYFYYIMKISVSISIIHNKYNIVKAICYYCFSCNKYVPEYFD